MRQDFGEAVLESESNPGELEEQTQHLIRQLTYLAFCLDAFVMSTAMSKEYIDSFDTLSDIAKSAFTKAILIGYATPFITNELEDGNSIQVSTKYLTKSATFDRDFHSALMELRHNLVAHASYEQPGFVANVARFHNTRPDTHLYEEIFVPIQYYLQNTSMGFVHNKQTIERLIDHITTCESLTKVKASELVEKLGAMLISHAPNVGSLNCVSVLDDVHNDVTAKSETDDLSIEVREQPLEIGRDNVQFLVTRLRMDRPFKGDHVGDGYRIKSDPSDSNITVSFLAKPNDSENA